jgi:hypothetical protein
MSLIEDQSPFPNPSGSYKQTIRKSTTDAAIAAEDVVIANNSSIHTD